MKRQSLFAIVILLWTGMIPANAQSGSDKKPVGIDFFKEVKMISNLKEKNGNIYCIIKQADVEGNNYASDLYLLDDGVPRPLTSTHDIGEYYLLDDGSILFKAAREAADKERIRKGEPLSVYLRLSPRIGEATEAFRLPYAVGDIKLVDEKHFFFTAAYDHSFNQWLEQSAGDMDKALKEKEKNSSYRIFDEIPFWSNGRGDVSGKRTHLYYYDDGAVTSLSETFETVGGLTLSTDKQTLLYTSNTYRGKAPRGNRLMALHVPSLKAEDITPLDETASYGSFSFLPGDDVILSVNTHIDDIGNASIHRLNLRTGVLTLLYGGDPYGAGNSIGSDVKMGNVSSGIKPDKQGFYYITTVNDHAPLIHVAYKDASVSFITQGKESILEYLPFGDGFLAIAMTGNRAAEIYSIDRKGALAPLSHLNDHLLTDFNILTPQPLTFRNENGIEITGYVIPPAHREQGKKYPTILDIHGGPKTAFGATLFHEMQYWANQGYAVIFTNPTGSDGGGNAFADIKARYGETDYRDLMTFTDAAIAAFDFIDPARIGVTGGSYGGFMTNWIIGHTDRFKAAASQRSIASWISFSNTTDIGYTFIQSQIGGDAWSDHDGLWRQSPLRYADKVKTPTLFIHSDEDYRCWESEGIQMFYALKYFEVPSRLVLFKGENHELSRSGRPLNRIKRLQEITDWMNTYL
ncbi:MAG: S9 family peptidase [Tannerellaceae bacterium]|jgi:dipeptidyl aminopeptidase/acylaminoacyl peptidase|nr:S9 family peptidase [Tannerellaceae bacterium]